MAGTRFDAINEEIKTSCPIVNQILSAMLEIGYRSEKKHAALALIYAMIMFKRSHEMSLLQRVNTVLLVDGGVTQQVITNGANALSRVYCFSPFNAMVTNCVSIFRIV